MGFFDMFKYPVNVVIDDVRHGSFIRRYDKAKAVYDKEFDIPEYYLKKIKFKIKPPSFQYIVRDEKGHDCLHLMQIERNRFVPVLPPLEALGDTAQLKAKLEEDVVVNTWNRVIREKKKQVYGTMQWFEKYGTVISIAMIGMIMIFALIFTQQYMEKNIIVRSDEVASRLDLIATRLEDKTSVVQGSSSTPQPEPSPP